MLINPSKGKNPSLSQCKNELCAPQGNPLPLIIPKMVLVLTPKWCLVASTYLQGSPLSQPSIAQQSLLNVFTHGHRLSTTLPRRFFYLSTSTHTMYSAHIQHAPFEIRDKQEDVETHKEKKNKNNKVFLDRVFKRVIYPIQRHQIPYMREVQNSKRENGEKLKARPFSIMLECSHLGAQSKI